MAVGRLPLLLVVLALFSPSSSHKPEVRWYTSAGSRGQFDEEKAHM
jgi:hypothetical protein